MFLEILDLIYESLKEVINALDVPLFYIGDVDITFWEIVLGFFIVNIIFGFFLRERMGSGLGAIKIHNDFENSQRQQRMREADRDNREAYNRAMSEYRQSYEYYAEKRSRNEEYARRYNKNRGR